MFLQSWLPRIREKFSYQWCYLLALIWRYFCERKFNFKRILNLEFYLVQKLLAFENAWTSFCFEFFPSNAQKCSHSFSSNLGHQKRTAMNIIELIGSFTKLSLIPIQTCLLTMYWEIKVGYIHSVNSRYVFNFLEFSLT